ncbi:MAG: YbhB/YbcL family Raf kinase inhibitor-like protein [Candidatus Dependentiae bacterium]
MKKLCTFFICALVLPLSFFGIKGAPLKLYVINEQFKNNDPIPAEFSCDGNDSSPRVWWENIPQSTKSLALICDDPDAPGGTWDHWIVFNIPSQVTAIEKNASAQDIPAIYGTNSWGKNKYGGPCPPSGIHRYYFTLYALDTELSLTAKATKKDILKAMNGHIIERAQIMGTYQRKK